MDVAVRGVLLVEISVALGQGQDTVQTTNSATVGQLRRWLNNTEFKVLAGHENDSGTFPKTSSAPCGGGWGKLSVDGH